MKIKNIILFLGILTIIVSCASDTIQEEPIVEETIAPSVKSITPLTGIEGDTVAVELADYKEGEISGVKFGTYAVPWFALENTTIKTVVPNNIPRGGSYNVNMLIDSKTTTSTQVFQTTYPIFNSIDKSFFALGDTLELGGLNLTTNAAQYSVALTNGVLTFDAEVTEVTENSLKFVRNEHPGGSPFSSTYTVKVAYNGTEISADQETTLTRAFTISDEFNSVSHAPGSLLKVNIYPGDGIGNTIKLGGFELTSDWSWSSDNFVTYAYTVPTNVPIDEVLKVSFDDNGIPFVLRPSGRDSLTTVTGTFDFSPKTVTVGSSTELTFQVSHVYSPNNYKVTLVNQTTGEEQTIPILNEVNVEQNSLTVSGLFGGSNAGVYQVKFSILDDEYLLTAENGAELVVE